MTTFVLVHGSWCGGWVWRDVARLLQEQGHRVVVVDQLPSSGPDPAALGDLAADTAHLRELLDDTPDAVLVAHSYGGVVSTEVADHPAIRHSVYVAAYWPERGRSMLDLLGAGPLSSWIVPHSDGTIGVSDDVDAVRAALCPDLDAGHAAEFHRRLGLQAGAAVATPCAAPDRNHATTYMVAERDIELRAAAQEAMAARADHVVRIAAAHMVMLSRPAELAAVLAGTR